MKTSKVILHYFGLLEYFPIENTSLARSAETRYNRTYYTEIKKKTTLATVVRDKLL